MKESLLSLCESFIQNRDAVKSAFGWDSAYIYPVCAAIFTDKRLPADPGRMKECRAMLKEATGIFSNFRGTARLAMISLLAADADPGEKLQRSLSAYATLKERFLASQYLPVASMIIADLAEPERFTKIAERTRRIYERMKQEHPLLTSSEDSVFCALLALSDLPDAQIVEKTERCYTLLKPRFFSGNAVQSLSHVLALGDAEPESGCERTLALFEELKRMGYPYGVRYELPTLGVLALIPEDIPTIAGNVTDAADWLKQQRGYGFFGVGRAQRLMHAGMLVTSDYLGAQKRPSMTSAAIGATISLIAAQQAAICAAIAASSAASASASS